MEHNQTDKLVIKLLVIVLVFGFVTVMSLDDPCVYNEGGYDSCLEESK